MIISLTPKILDSTESMATEATNASANPEPGFQFPKSPMPAWVPAVSVAIAMMIFLAMSFYLRHRKVLKKRQILMDYFYIIFQYGGARRKRMVAALCNTNSITLRQLGRSFMISFDSIANNDNSCPFFLEDTAFSHQSTAQPKRTMFRSKSRSGGNRSRTPFRSPSPTGYRNQRVQQQQQHSPSGFQEIRMKFKSRKGASPEPCISDQSQMRLMPPRLGSLSSIHDDDPSAHISYHEGYTDTSSRANERRNAYVFNYDSSGSVILEEEFEKPQIPHIVLERLQHQSSGKRNSEPIYCEGGYDPHGNTHLRVLPDEAPKIYGTRVLYPSTDRLDSKSESGTLYRNSEPTIMIHSASNDFGSSFELEDLQSQCSNGLVFVKKVTNEDGTEERYYINERPTQTYNLQRQRPSLSKVSYVPSGNMNDYYHNCLQSPKKTKPTIQRNTEESGSGESKTDEKSKSGWPWKKPGSKKTAEIEVPTPPAGRRGRLSLGDIAVSNFNRRIVDFPSESLGSVHDSDQESGVNKLAKDQAQKPNTAWRRLKNVFSGSRSSQSSVTKQKSMQGSEDRGKRGGRRVPGRWSRFVNVLMGFRSLTDSRHPKHTPLRSKNSKSLPMGLDKQMRSTEEFDFRRGSHAVSLDSHSSHYIYRGGPESLFGKMRNRVIPPPGMRIPPKTQSFPEDMLKMQDSTERPNHPTSPRRNVVSFRHSGRKYKRKHSSFESYSRPRSNSEVHRHYLSNQTSSQSSGDDPYARHHHTMSTMSSPRSKSPLFTLPQDLDGECLTNRDKHYKSLSPLPKRWFKSSPRRKSKHFFSQSERNSFSEKGKSVLPYLAYSTDLTLPFSLIDSRFCCDSLPENSDKIAPSNVSPCKTVKKNRQLSAGTIEPIGKDYNTLDVTHIHKDTDSLLKYRHSISGPTCNSATANGHARVYRMDDIEPATLHSKQTLTLDVDPKHLGTSMDSVYYDTVSVLGSPCSSLKQNTVPNTPNAIKNDHCVLEMPSPYKDFPTNSNVDLMKPSSPDSFETPFNGQSKERNCINGSSENSQTLNSSPTSVVMITPKLTVGDNTAIQPNSNHMQQELPAVGNGGDIKPRAVSRIPLHSQSSTASHHSTTSHTSCLSYDSQPSIMSSASLEIQSPSLSLTSTSIGSNDVKTSDSLHQKSFGQSLEMNESISISPLPLDGSTIDSTTSSADGQGNTTPSILPEVTAKFPLDLPTQGSATFHMVSETFQKNSPEEAAIFNLTRLPRFGRRPSQCSHPSPLSEHGPGSGSNTLMQQSATLLADTNGSEI